VALTEEGEEEKSEHLDSSNSNALRAVRVDLQGPPRQPLSSEPSRADAHATGPRKSEPFVVSHSH